MAQIFRDLDKIHDTRKTKASIRSNDIPNQPFTPMSLDGLPKDTDINYLFHGLVVERHHTVLVGGAGSFKTSLAFYAALQIVKNTEKIVHYWPFDVSTSTLEAMMLLRRGDRTLEKKFLIPDFSYFNVHRFKKIYSNMDELTTCVIVLDTLGFIMESILDKDSNKKTMEFLRTLTQRGATILSLSHLNKNKKNYAGTAEIEQLSDALLKIEPLDVENEHIVTVKPLGRVRYAFDDLVFTIPKIKEKSEYKRLYHTTRSIRIIHESETFLKEKRLKQKIEKHKDFISIVRDHLDRAGGTMNQSRLVSLLYQNSKNPLSKNNILSLLRDEDFVDRFWSVQRVKKNNTLFYKLIR